MRFPLHVQHSIFTDGSNYVRIIKQWLRMFSFLEVYLNPVAKVIIDIFS